MGVRGDEIERAKAAGVKMLRARDLTRAEVTARLGQRGFDADAVEQAVLALEAMGAIDDRRVAEAYARRQLEGRGDSRDLIEATLLERGVEAGVVAEVLAQPGFQVDPSAEALELARQRVRRSSPRTAPEMVVRRAFEFLRRRGYDEETCQQAAERAAEEYLGPGGGAA